MVVDLRVNGVLIDLCDLIVLIGDDRIFPEIAAAQPAENDLRGNALKSPDFSSFALARTSLTEPNWKLCPARTVESFI